MIAAMTELHPPTAPARTAPGGTEPGRFFLAWLFPLAIGLAAWASPWAAWGAALGIQLLLAALERWPRLAHSPPPAQSPVGTATADAAAVGARWVPRLHVVWQAALLAFGVSIAMEPQAHAGGLWALVALGIGVGAVTGSQGITFAHELGHSRSRFDRALAWVLMASVSYAHFMVEHYRGHHPRAATFDDPASARRGESLWRFLPRTLAGSWRSAWRLERRQLDTFGRSWLRSPLAWATLAQAAAGIALTAVFGVGALVFWCVQSAYAIYLLETINYVEHYGLQRRTTSGRSEPFGVQHAWNADHWLTNCLLVNLQRHSDHHMHAWKPYTELEALPGPQLPTGYAGCLFVAAVPRWWFALMHPRLAALDGRDGAASPAASLATGGVR
jgi:alkane 1-monooxygenase